MSKASAPFTVNLSRDGSGTPIQNSNKFTTLDATGTPKASPLAVSSTIITITVPDRAVEMIMNPSAALRISEDPAMVSYDVIAANVKESIPCAAQQSIYVVRDSADVTLNFRFHII